jgi:short-subunit dehydrogenase
LWGVIHGCHVFAPRLKRQKSGHIINVASAAGLLSPPQLGPYNVTKAGVIALSETLFGELAADGVGVTVLCPTFFRTHIHDGARGIDTEKWRHTIERLMDRGRLGAEDVARAALAGAEAGQLYVVPQSDGKWMWRIKRTSPSRFHAIGGKVIEEGARRLGIRLD